MAIRKPLKISRKIKLAKPITFKKSQLSSSAKTLLSKPKAKEPLFEGKYSRRLTKRVPRKRIKAVKPIEFNKPYLSNYDRRLVGFRHAFENKFGHNIFKTKGEKLHVFLPMTSMSPQGYLLKGFFEQTLPQARVTFLVTPSRTALRFEKDPKFRPKALKNLENHLRRSINVHDKYFVCFDYSYTGETIINIYQALNKICGKNVNFMAVDAPVDAGVSTHSKTADGSSIIPHSFHSKTKMKNIMQEHYNAGIELSRDKSFISELKG